MTRRPWTTIELQTLRELAGMNAVQVATHLDRSPAAIAAMAKRIGVELSPMPGTALPDSSIRRLRLLRGRGAPVREIARRMGVSKSVVSKWTREAAA